MRYNLSKIRGKSAYSLLEVSQLLKINRKTVTRWLNEGLELLDPHQAPKLIMGADLKAFIKAKRESVSVKLKWNEYYCLKCRAAVVVKRGTEKTLKTGRLIGANNRDQEMMTGICKECSGSVARFI